MGASAALLGVFVIWCAIGATSAIVMGRRGHDPWSWGVVGALFGPLVVPVAWASLRDDRRRAPLLQAAHQGARGTGRISLLVGIDGSDEAAAAAATASSLFGPQLGRVVLASVVDFDAVSHATGPDNVFVVEAKRHLDDAAAAFTMFDADRVVLVGQPAHALLQFAAEEHIDVVAVGARGHGLSQATLGSVAAQLVDQKAVPVLIAGAATAN
jgi:nucleotide-binding universal stress UspA family protein